MTKTIITCPECGTKFDIKNAYDEIKQELLKEIDIIINKMKENKSIK